MTPISARSRSWVTVGCSISVPSGCLTLVMMLSSSARVSSAVSTGVLPFFTTYFGLHTAWAGLVSIMWPVTGQSNSIRSAAKCCLTVGGENWPCSSLTKAAAWKGCTCANSSRPCASHHCAKAARGVQVGFAHVVVIDMGGEEFPHAPRRLRGRREQPGREQAGGRGEDDLRAHSCWFSGFHRALG
jgi:hypothetical protein